MSNRPNFTRLQLVDSFAGLSWASLCNRLVWATRGRPRLLPFVSQSSLTLSLSLSISLRASAFTQSRYCATCAAICLHNSSARLILFDCHVSLIGSSSRRVSPWFRPWFHRFVVVFSKPLAPAGRLIFMCPNRIFFWGTRYKKKQVCSFNQEVLI